MKEKKTRQKRRALSDEHKPCLWCGKTISRMGKSGYRMADKGWERTKHCSINCAARIRGQKKTLLFLSRADEKKACIGCGVVILRTIEGIVKQTSQWKRQKYCTIKCAKSYRSTMPEYESSRVYKFIDKRTDDDCWIWLGYRDKDGYGRTFFRGQKSVQSHRAVYILHHGEIPPGQIIRHSCDNPPCNNIRHLLAGSYQDNANDREERGRRKPIHRDSYTQTKIKSAELARLLDAYRSLPRTASGQVKPGFVASLAAEFQISVQSALHLTAPVRIGETYVSRQRRKDKLSL